MRRSGIGIVFLMGFGLWGQAPGSYDAEGNLYWKNGTGRYPLERQGVWRVNPLSTSGAGVGAAEVQGMKGTLDRLSAVMQATPEAGNMRGYWMRESRNYQVQKWVGAKVPLRFEAGFFPFVLEDILKNGQYVPQWSGETESIWFRFNVLPGALGRRVLVKDGERDVYLRPRVTGTYQGYPVYEGQDLVVAREGRDPWAAVTYGTALRLTLPLLEKDKATAEERLAGLRKKNEETQSAAYEAQMRAHLEKYSGEWRTKDPQKWAGREKGMVRELQYNRERAAKEANPRRDAEGAWYWNPVEALEEATARMAKLDPTEAAMPACFVQGERAGRYSFDGRIEVMRGQAGCEPVVVDNWGYFDEKRPRTEAQLLVVWSLGRCGKLEGGRLIPNWKPVAKQVAHGCARHPVIWDQMDWRAVGALVSTVR